MAFLLTKLQYCAIIIPDIGRVGQKKKERQEMNKNSKFLLCTVAAFIPVIVLYILFHELGHLIVMLSAGDVIDDFSILGAHVSGHGGEYTLVSAMWLNANGAVLPLIISFVYLLFYNKDRNSTFYRLFSFFFGFAPASSLLAWVIIPFAYIKGSAPAGDDATKFLDSFSQIAHPLLVSAAALLLIVPGIILLIKKGAFRNYIYELRQANKKAAADPGISQQNK